MLYTLCTLCSPGLRGHAYQATSLRFAVGGRPSPLISDNGHASNARVKVECEQDVTQHVYFRLITAPSVVYTYMILPNTEAAYRQRSHVSYRVMHLRIQQCHHMIDEDVLTTYVSSLEYTKHRNAIKKKSHMCTQLALPFTRAADEERACCYCIVSGPDQHSLMLLSGYKPKPLTCSCGRIKDINLTCILSCA